MNENILATPPLWHNKLTAIRAHIIVEALYIRGIIGPLILPFIVDIDIYSIAIAIQLPVSLHRHRTSRGVIKVELIEIQWSLIGITNPMKIPIALNCEVAVRDALVILLCQRHRIKDKEIRC